MSEVFMLVEKLYKDRGGGINKVVMDRSSSIAKRGYNVSILTVADFNIEITNKKLIQSKRLNEKVKHINIYDYYKKLNTNSDMTRKQKRYLKTSTKLHEQHLQIHRNKSKNEAKYFQNGLYIKKKKWHKDNSLACIEYFNKNKKRVKQETFHSSGYVNKITYYNLHNKHKSHVQYFTTDGFCFLDVWYKDKNELDRYYLFNRFNNKVKQFLTTSKFQKNWLEELMSKCKYKPYLICDKRMFAPLVMDIKSNVYKIYAVHTNHHHRKNLVFSEENAILNHIKNLEQVVTLTKKQKNDILMEYGNYNNIKIIPHSIPESPKISENKDQYLISLVARLSPTKQIHHAIEAFKDVIREVPEAKLEIYGTGRVEAALKQQVEELGLTNHVFLKGYTNGTNQVYQKSTATLLTSKSEAFAMVVLESMINETPVISYDINYGPSDMITDNIDGYLISENINKLSEKIVYLLKNPKKANEMGRVGRKKILKKYHNDLITNRWIDLFKDLKRKDK